MTDEPLTNFVIAIDRGMPYSALFDFEDLVGYDSSVWRLRISSAGSPDAFWQSTPSHWTAQTATRRLLLIPADETAGFPAGPINFQLDVLNDAGMLPSFRARLQWTDGYVTGDLAAPT